MEPMGATQPGLPSPVAIPQSWFMLIIDLKDCFFTIPLHPKDCKRFAFSVPSTNFKEPAHRFHWVVLPQGMANSPTLCQIYVAAALRPLRDRCPQLYIVHYMDDILLSGPNKTEVLEAFADLREDLQSAGMVLAPEKIQQNFPYQYLGHQLLQKGIKPLRLQIRLDKLKTLNDFQKLLGDINWLRPSLHLGTGQLKPLFEILKGEPSPTSLRTLTPEGRKCLELLQDALEKAHLNYIDYNKPFSLIIFASSHSPTGLFWQNGPLLWVHSQVSPAKVVMAYYQAVVQLLFKAQKNEYSGLWGRA